MRWNVLGMVAAVVLFSSTMYLVITNAIDSPGMFLLCLLAGVAFAFNLMQLMKKREYESLEPTPFSAFWSGGTIKVFEAPDPTKLPGTFCPDCGQRSIYFQAQRGFNFKTGLPQHHTLTACPDWDRDYEAVQAAMMTRYINMGGASDWREADNLACGNIVKGPFEPALKHEHDESEAKLECVRCLLDMEKIGALSKVETSERLAKLMDA